MSHSWNCPDDYEARRAARWDAEDGFNRHRYDRDCEHANKVYEREYRSQELYLENQRAEERAANRRREACIQEDAFYAQQQGEYEEMLCQQEADHWAAVQAEEEAEYYENWWMASTDAVGRWENEGGKP